MVVGYVVWGNKPSIYLQSAFSALTFLVEPLVEKVCIVTERPEWYAKFGSHLKVIPASQAELETWSGKENYSFRRKIMGFSRIAEQNPGHDFLFIDSDTFRGGSIARAQQCIAAGLCGMHEDAGFLTKADDSRNRKLYKLLHGKTIEGFTIDSTTRRLNAGAIALPGKLAGEALAKALRATETIHALTNGYWASEELAFNFALMSLGQVEDISDGMGHYFGNKPQWNAMITEFFARTGLANASIDAMITEASQFDFTSIPVFIHPPKRRRQLQRIADKYWPMTRPRHFPTKVHLWD